MTDSELLAEYHRRIGEIFLAPDQTPFRICKQLWALYGEFEWRLALEYRPFDIYLQHEADKERAA